MSADLRLEEILVALESYRGRHLVPSYFVQALVQLRAIVKESHEALDEAIRLIEARQVDVPDSVDITLDANAFAAGYIVAVGGIREALIRLRDNRTTPTTQPGELKGDDDGGT